VVRVAGQGLTGMGHPGQEAIAQVADSLITFVGVVVVSANSLNSVTVTASVGCVVTMTLMFAFTWWAARQKYL